MRDTRKFFWVFALLAWPLGGCRGSAAAPRVPAATIPAAASAAPTSPPRQAGPDVALRAGSVHELVVTLDASDPRRSVRLWLSESGYRARVEEMCAQDDDEQPDDDGSEPTAAEAFRREALAALHDSCTVDRAFDVRTIALTGDGVAISRDRRQWKIPVAWLGSVPLGGATIESFAYAAKVIDAGETPELAFDDVREAPMKDGLMHLPSAAFAKDHDDPRLFADEGVLLPGKDGLYLRSEEKSEEMSSMAPPVQTGWEPAELVRDDKDGLRLLAHGSTIVLTWPGGSDAIDLASQLSRYGVLDAKILDHRSRGGREYALVSVTTMSRGGMTGGMCGAGQEVEWIHLELGSTIAKMSNENVESCFSTTSVEIVSAPNARVILGKRQTYSDGEKTDCVRFDRERPEAGVQIAKSCGAPSRARN